MKKGNIHLRSDIALFIKCFSSPLRIFTISPCNSNNNDLAPSRAIFLTFSKDSMIFGLYLFTNLVATSFTSSPRPSRAA